MHWLRARMRLGSCLALFALTIQLILSFGHLHFDGIPSRSGLGSLMLRWVIQPPATLPDVPSAPTKDEPASLVDHFCAICSVTQLAGVPVTAPMLPLPISNSRISLDVNVEAVLALSPHPFFQARAPPV